LQIGNFLLTQSDEIAGNKEEIKQKLLKAIMDDNMAPYYLQVCEQLKWNVDNSFLEKMKAENEKKIKAIGCQLARCNTKSWRK